jgi:hypothetical protein
VRWRARARQADRQFIEALSGRLGAAATARAMAVRVRADDRSDGDEAR